MDFHHMAMNLMQDVKRKFFQTGALKILFLTVLGPILLSQPAWCQRVPARQVGTKEFFLAFCCVVMVGIATNAYLFGLIRPGEGVSRFQRLWEFSAVTFGGFSWKGLALWSLLSLFMELLMIRWISSEIRIFAYFNNFVLIACYLGFGLGCYLSRRKVNLLLMFVPLFVLTALIRIPWTALRAMISQLPAFVGASAGMQVWGVPSARTLPMLAAATAV